MLALLLLALSPTPNPGARADPLADAPKLAARVDEFAAKHWQEQGVQPTGVAPDVVFLRRVTLDLAGRIPTVEEARAFAEDRAPDKRLQALRRLLTSPEYPLHMGRVLDEMLQGRGPVDAEFVQYLRDSLAARKPWDRLFREMILGPWEAKEVKGADRFLTRRLNNLDDLTNDTSRVFFGVNVSCAKCHDHPLVADWTQDHYYGLASFFNPTVEGSKGKQRRAGAAAAVTEKETAEVMYVTTKGERRTAKLLFLSNQTFAPDKTGRREQLVQIALTEKTFFSRAVVNKYWAYFFGRGLVHPVDQMHSANPPAIPGLLEYLAEDLAAHGYDLDRLVAGLLASRTYQLASTLGPGGEGLEKDFAQARLRPLTPDQFAASALLATGEVRMDDVKTPEQRTKRFKELEGQSGRFSRTGLLDVRGDSYQASTGEALFLSNNPEFQKLTAPAGKNLVARLAALTDPNQVVDLATWSILSRPANDEERAYLAQWLTTHGPDRARACGQLVWALLTSAEFRFIP